MLQERIYAPGESIGPFKVVRLLGSGAMGTIYEARPDPVDRRDFIAMNIKRVAIKVARIEAMARTPEERRQMEERLYREYRTLLGLQNPVQPHLPDVYEFGWQDGMPFMAMEYIDGPSLEEVLAGRPPMQETLEVFRKLCGAVASLHQRGIVHRDIKPSNVLVQSGEPLLIDFSHCLPPLVRRITGPRELIGTLIYASPQAGAHARRLTARRPYPVTPADDVWGLGVVLYEVLTGDVPWRTPPDRRGALVREMLRGPPRHPSDVNPEVPRALGDFALGLLHPDPARRPRDGRAVLELLDPVLKAVGPMTGRVPGLPWPRMPSALPPAAKIPLAWSDGRNALAIAAAVLIVVGLGVFGWRRLGMHGATPAATTQGAKVLPLAALPVPSEPLPGQMRAPCPNRYVEASGACWDEVQLKPLPDGTLGCPDDNDLIREMKGKDGRLRCLLAVMTRSKTPSVEVPAKSGP